MEWIVGLISAVTAFIGAIWGIVKYYDAKGVKEQEKREKQKRSDKEPSKNERLAATRFLTTLLVA